MVRENRYLVIKIKDAREALSEQEIELLNTLNMKVNLHRAVNKGQEPLSAVVVESDWPEYESTWRAIERRVDSQN